MSDLRLGLIGFGNMGSAHAAAIHEGRVEGLSLAAVCDIDPARLKVLHEHYPEVKTFADPDELFGSTEIDCVLIATPHRFHAALALQALRHHKHVLLEKPIDVRLSEAKKLTQAAKTSRLVFGIMFNQRTTPIFQRAREMVQKGELGTLKRSVWLITNWYRTQHYYDSGDWRATWGGEGGGVLLNQAPHNLDLWQWICGMPSHVRAFCDVARYHRIEVEDDATILTRYPGGATGLFVTSTGEYPGTNRLEISGTLGKLVLENGKLRHWKLQRPEEQVRYTSEDSMPHIPYDYSEEAFDTPPSGHLLILQNFTNAILHGEALLAPGIEGVNELTISNASYLSAWTGNAEIALPMDTAKFDALLLEKSQASSYKRSAASSKLSREYSDRWQVNW